MIYFQSNNYDITNPIRIVTIGERMERCNQVLQRIEKWLLINIYKT